MKPYTGFVKIKEIKEDKIVRSTIVYVKNSFIKPPYIKELVAADRIVYEILCSEPMMVINIQNYYTRNLYMLYWRIHYDAKIRRNCIFYSSGQIAMGSIAFSIRNNIKPVPWAECPFEDLKQKTLNRGYK